MYPIECAGIIGLLFGHKFRAKYHEEKFPPDGSFDIKAPSRYSLESQLEKLCHTKLTYVHSVCSRCGLTTDTQNA